MATMNLGNIMGQMKQKMSAQPTGAPPSSYAAQAQAIGDSAQASAATGTFDESKGVAGRVQQLTNAGSPLMTAARTRAKRASAARGLLNSSLAGQAGEQAVIETATPIASGDAQLYQSQQLANQSAQNQVNLANANIRAQTGMAGLQLGENARQFDTGLAWDQDKFGTNLVEQRRQFDQTMGLEGRKLDQNQSQFQAQLGQQDRQFAENLQLQRDNLAAQREQFAQKLGLDVAQLDLAKNQLSQQDRQFLADLDQKQQQLAQQAAQFSSNLLEQRRQFDTTAGMEGQKLSQQDAQFKQNLEMQRSQLDAQREQFAQSLGMDKEKLQLSRDQLSQQDKQFLAELDQRDKQLAQQESQFTRDMQNKVTLANLDAANREKLIQIEAGYKQEIAGNENISRAWGTMMDSINQIQNNPELDYSTKSTLISNTQASFQSFANFWKKATGGSADVSDLLQFSQAPAPSPGSGGGSPGGPNVGNGNDDYYWSGDRGG